MKMSKFTLVAATVFSLTACSKDELVNNEEQHPTTIASNTSSATDPGTADAKRAYVSDWEKMINWTQRDSGSFMSYRNTRITPQVDESIMGSGAVLVFVKDYRNDEGELVPSPARLSFQLEGRPDYFNEWYQENKQGE